MADFKSKIMKSELVYRFDNGILMCSNPAQTIQSNLLMDLNTTTVTITCGKGWFNQMQFFLYTAILCIPLFGIMWFNDYRQGDTIFEFLNAGVEAASAAPWKSITLASGGCVL